MLEDLPEAVRAAFESGAPEQAAAAMKQLPPEEQHAVMAALSAAAYALGLDPPPGRAGT